MCTLAGILSLSAVINLPPSESKSAVIASFSPWRIFTWGFLGLGTLISLGLFIKSQVTPDWSTRVETIIHTWHKTHSFLSSAYFCLSLALILLLGGLDYLMDVQRFPRMAYYIFLHVRLRPICLWLMAVTILSLILTFTYRWLTLSLRDFLPSNRASRAGAYCLLVVFTGTLVMWVNLLRDPIFFEDKSSLWLPMIFISIPVLFIGLFLIDRQGKSKTE